MVKNVFLLQEEIIDVFYKNKYNPTMDFFSFHIAHVWILIPILCGKAQNKYFIVNTGKIV